MDPDAIVRALAGGAIVGHIISRADHGYDAARRVWNGMADRRPAAVVRARTDGDVAAVVRLAAEHDVLLAVRGAGHSLPGLSTCDDGIVLDLSLMADVQLDPVARLVTVGGGARLGDMDRAGAPFGLVTPAGVVSHTGVAGLTLGGGMGWLSRRLGLTIDSLVGVTIVLADGERRVVDATSEPELFWGLRGGGGNFGVVTSFRFRQHEIGAVVIGAWLFDQRGATAALRDYQDLAADSPRELTSSFSLTRSGLNVTAVWSGFSEGAIEAVEAFGRIGSPVSRSVGEQTYLGLQSRSDEHFRWGRRYYAKGGFIATVDARVGDTIEAAIDASPTQDSEVYVIQLGGAVADIPDSATAYQGRAAAYYWIVEPVWDDPQDDDRCLGWGHEVGRAMTERSMAGNYVNEQADAGSGVALAAYGEETYRRLADLKAQYDPTNVFRLNQNIEPAPAARTKA